MARIANWTDFGFQEVHEVVAAMMASFISDPHGSARMLDAYAGRAIAASIIAGQCAIPTGRLYLNDIHDERAKECAKHATHVTCCDTLKALQATRHFSQLAYLNPPFSEDTKNEGGSRLEIKGFRRVIEEGMWVQPGGVTILVTPQDIFARQEGINHLARCYDNLRIYQLPDTYRRWREAVVFGVVRDSPRIGIELRTEAARIKELLAGELPILEQQPEPLYLLPKPIGTKKKIIWKDGSLGTPTMAMQDVIKGGGAWRSKSHTFAHKTLTHARLRPASPLNPSQSMIRIADGEINGEVLEIGGRLQLIKGSTEEKTEKYTETRETTNAMITDTINVTRRVPVVFTLDESDGTIRCYSGDHGMAELMANKGTAQSLLDAVTCAAPPKYRLDMDPLTAGWLNNLQRADGRALPGYEPGLIPMQKHLAAAMVRFLTTYDDAWGETPDAGFLAVEMGGGKCICEGTSIPTEHGLVPIESLMPTGTAEDSFAPLEIVVQTPDGPRHTSHFYNSGTKPTRRIMSRCGYELTGTTVHPVLVLNQDGERQWKRLAHVAIGDYVAIQRHDQVWGTTTVLPPFTPIKISGRQPKPVTIPSSLTEELAYLFGLIVGDGCMRHINSVGFTAADAPILDQIQSVLTPIGLTIVQDSNKPYGYRIHSRLFKEWLNHLGFMNVLSVQKEIPPCILQAPQSIVRAFLQGLFDTDGSALNDGTIEYGSASKRLAHQVHLLLLQFGIIAIRRFKPNPKACVWTISLHGREAQSFYEHIGFRLKRKQERIHLLPVTSNTHIDVIPHLPVIQFDKVPREFRMYLRTLQAPGYANLRQMAEHYPELQSRTTPAFFWDKIVTIEDTGLQPCYDLTVPGTHAFVSNGIVSHNTSIGLGVAHVLHHLDEAGLLQ